MGGIDGQWCQNREQLAFIQLFQPGHVGLVDVFRRQQVQAVFLKLVADVRPYRLLLAHQLPGGAVDHLKLFMRRMTVDRQYAHAFADLALQAGDTHHVEFIEIVGRNRQEAQAFQQRMARVLGFFNDALVEGQPAQFTIDIERRVQRFVGAEIKCCRGRRRMAVFRH